MTAHAANPESPNPGSPNPGSRTIDPLPCPPRQFDDPRTGRAVTRLSDWPGCHCMTTYMYHQAATADERHVVFASNRSGRFESYRLDVETGQAFQVTRRLGEAYRGDAYGDVKTHLAPDGRTLIYGDKPGVMAADIFTGEARVVIRQQPDWQGLSLGDLSADGRWLLVAYRNKQGRQAIAYADLHEEKPDAVTTFYQTPTREVAVCHVLWVARQFGAATFDILPDHQNDTHGDDTHRARAWVAYTDGREPRPFLTVPVGWRATHEFWATDPQGQPRLFYHGKTVPTWTPATLESVDVEGNDRREHYRSDDRPLGHSAVAPDGRCIVTDVQDPNNNELIRISLVDGRSEVLCWPNSSCASGNMTHVHPVFSPTGRYVMFNSDAAGHNAAFRVAVD